MKYKTESQPSDRMKISGWFAVMLKKLTDICNSAVLTVFMLYTYEEAHGIDTEMLQDLYEYMTG